MGFDFVGRVFVWLNDKLDFPVESWFLRLLCSLNVSVSPNIDYRQLKIVGLLIQLLPLAGIAF